MIINGNTIQSTTECSLQSKTYYIEKNELLLYFPPQKSINMFYYILGVRFISGSENFEHCIFRIYLYLK